MNILNKFEYIFISTIFFDENDKLFNGGAEIHLHNLISALDLDPSKTLVIQMGSQNQLIETDLYSILRVKTKSQFIYKLKLRWIIGKLSPKLVHVNYLGLDLFIKKSDKTTYSGTFHGTGWDFPTSNFPEPYISNSLITQIGSKLLKFYMILEQVRAIKKLDFIISVDTSLIRFTQQFLTNHRNKIFTIYNFVDRERFHPSIKPSSEKKYTILYPRNISYARGAHLLVPIANGLRDIGMPFSIKIVGASINQISGNKYQDILLTEISQHNLQEKFEMLGRITHDQMPKVFQESDIVIIPTYFSEGTSLSCLEAMSSNKPVIATNIGGLNDLIINGYNGIIVNPDPSEFVNAISYLYTHKDYVNRLISNAKNLIDENYTHEKWASTIQQTFSKYVK